MAKKKSKKQEGVEVPPSFAPVVAAFSKERQVSTEKGWGSGNLAMKVNGNIFAMLVKGKLVVQNAQLLREAGDALLDYLDSLRP